jgi:hypothetical protein
MYKYLFPDLLLFMMIYKYKNQAAIKSNFFKTTVQQTGWFSPRKWLSPLHNRNKNTVVVVVVVTVVVVV